MNDTNQAENIQLNDEQDELLANELSEKSQLTEPIESQMESSELDDTNEADIDLDDIHNSPEHDEFSLKSDSKEGLFIQFIEEWVLPNYTKHLIKIFETDVYLENEYIESKSIRQLADNLSDDESWVYLSTQFSSDLTGNTAFVLSEDNLLKLAKLYTHEMQEIAWTDENKKVFSNLFFEIITYLSNVLTNILNCVVVSEPIQLNKVGAVSELKNIEHEEDNNGILWLYSIVISDDGSKIPVYQYFSPQVIDDFYYLFSKIHLDLANEKKSQLSGLNVSSTRGTPEIYPIEYQNFKHGMQGPSLSGKNIALLLDLSMQLTVELGRSNMKIRDILSLGEGAIIELDKLAGEPVDLLVNSLPIARGEVVVIDENFGVRITDIIGASKRLETIF